MNLENLYKQERALKQQGDLDEAAARAHLGVIIDKTTSLKALYYNTVELSVGTVAENIMKQAAGLVKPSVWWEDDYRITDYSKRVSKIMLHGSMVDSEDKRHKELILTVNQSFVHQYYWNDQSLHVFEMLSHWVAKTVSRKLLGNYEAEFNQLHSEIEARLRRAEELKQGSQKYIKIRYAPETYDGGWSDDHGMYLFADGHSYIERSGVNSFPGGFRKAFNQNEIEETSRFIVRQIMQLNGDA